MKLGAFSVSLNVNDLQTSKSFYEKMGFGVFGGNTESGYLIMKNGNALIGLFQGMFEGNILTFNPKWNQSAEKSEDCEDIRQIQSSLKESGINILNCIDETGTGPASFFVTDPDGNLILFDQHV